MSGPVRASRGLGGLRSWEQAALAALQIRDVKISLAPSELQHLVVMNRDAANMVKTSRRTPGLSGKSMDGGKVVKFELLQSLESCTILHLQLHL